MERPESSWSGVGGPQNCKPTCLFRDWYCPLHASQSSWSLQFKLDGLCDLGVLHWREKWCSCPFLHAHFPKAKHVHKSPKRPVQLSFSVHLLPPKLNCSYLLDKNAISSLLDPLQYFPHNSVGFVNTFTLLTIKWKFLCCYSDCNSPSMWIYWFQQSQVELFILLGCSKLGFINITPLFPAVSSVDVGLFAIWMPQDLPSVSRVFLPSFISTYQPPISLLLGCYYPVSWWTIFALLCMSDTKTANSTDQNCGSWDPQGFMREALAPQLLGWCRHSFNTRTIPKLDTVNGSRGRVGVAIPDSPTQRECNLLSVCRGGRHLKKAGWIGGVWSAFHTSA